jgi:hypothetical protein
MLSASVWTRVATVVPLSELQKITRETRLPALLKVPFPAVSGANSAMKELVGFFTWILEADKVFTRDNGLLAFAAMDDCFSFHGSPPALCLFFLVGQLVSDLF